MFAWFKKLIGRTPEAKMQPNPIHINPIAAAQIERNKARIARLARAIEKGSGTPAIEAELAARKRAHAEFAAKVG